jgi:hypothetical protein
MHATRTHSSAPRASACGIPASTLLSVLDHDKAYSYLDACTVHRVPFNDLQLPSNIFTLNCSGTARTALLDAAGGRAGRATTPRNRERIGPGKTARPRHRSARPEPKPQLKKKLSGHPQEPEHLP